MTKHVQERRESGDRPALEITPQMVEAGRAVLREAFGGETEGQNRFVDFPDVAESVIRSALNQR